VHGVNRASLDGLLEEVPSSLELGSAEARGELGEVAEPEGKRVRVAEESHALLESLNK